MDAGIQDDLKIVGEDVWLTVPPYSEYLRTVRLVAADAAVRAGLDYDEVEDFRIAVDELCHLLMSSTDHEISVSFGVVGTLCPRPRARAAAIGRRTADAQRAVAHDHRLGRRPPRAHRQRRRARVRGDERDAERRRPTGRHAGRAMTDSPDTYEKFTEYRRTGDRALRNELVEEHVRLAEFLARRFSHRGEAHDDLRQVALVGLLKAVERFEPDRGLQFSSFATPTITGELKRHFRDRGWAVRVPRRIQELHLELDRTVNDLSQELGRPPTPAEIAQRAGVLEEDVLESMEAGSLYRLASIDAGRPDDESGTSPAQRLGELDAELGAVDDRVAVTEMLAVLPEREQNIVYLRFFEGLTQSEIAERIGISQMHVSRLLARSLETLGEHATAVAEA